MHSAATAVRMVPLELGSQDFFIADGNFNRAVRCKPPLLQLVSNILLYPRGLFWRSRMGEDQVLMAPVGGKRSSRLRLLRLLGSWTCQQGRAQCSQ